MFNMFDMGFGFVFSIFPIMFVLVFGLILFQLFNQARTWKKNNDSPKLHVNAKVVAKRNNVSRHHHAGTDHTMNHTHTTNTYYVTFEVESGDRLELHVPNHEFGYLVEGDRGTLEFQGTRYLSFKRSR